MVRTQIQLTEEQAERLKELAADKGVSMAELIRRSIDDFLIRRNGETMAEKRRKTLAIVGKYSDGAGDVSVNHDKYLADIYEEDLRRGAGA